MALDNALGTKTPDITGGTVDIIAGKKGKTPSVRDMIGVKGDIFQKMQSKNEELAQVESELPVKQATIKSGVETELAGQEKEQLQTAQKEMARLTIPEFEPTQETFLGLATMASLIAFVGRGVAGQAGTTSATGAINAMAGMMKGYQQGRKDVFEREKQVFDKNLATIKSKTEKLKNELELSMKMAATDRRAAESKDNIAIAEAGSPVLRAKYDKQGLEEASKFADGLMKDVQFLETERNKLLKTTAGAGGVKATQQLMIAQRAVTALRGAASAAENIMQLSAGARTGILPYLSSKEGLTNYVTNNAGRTLSSQETKAMETIYSGVSRYLATIEASGTATGLTVLAGQLEKLQPKAGDTVLDAALKIADIRRISTESISAMIESGLLPGQQAQAAQEQVIRMEKAIPYTTGDVINAITKGKKTMGEATQEAITKRPAFNTEAEAQSALDNGTIKPGQKITIGGKPFTAE